MLNCEICGRCIYPDDKTECERYCKWCIIELCEEFKHNLQTINKFLYKMKKNQIHTTKDMEEVVRLGMVEV